MKNEILEIIQKSEKTEFVKKEYEDNIFYFIRGQYGKKYLICEEKEGNLEKTLAMIEKICVEEDEIKEIRPQFIYAIILKKVMQITEQTFKDIIAIEENEYFCKKYVLYYDEKELAALKKWILEEKNACIGELLNSDNCIKYMDAQEDKDEKLAVNLLLRIIIKCPFIKYKFKKGNLSSFDNELKHRLEKVKKTDSNLLWEYKKEFYDKLEMDNIDKMVDLFIEKVRKEIQ